MDMACHISLANCGLRIGASGRQVTHHPKSVTVYVTRDLVRLKSLYIEILSNSMLLVLLSCLWMVIPHRPLSLCPPDFYCSIEKNVCTTTLCYHRYHEAKQESYFDTKPTLSWFVSAWAAIKASNQFFARGHYGRTHNFSTQPYRTNRVLFNRKNYHAEYICSGWIPEVSSSEYLTFQGHRH